MDYIKIGVSYIVTYTAHLIAVVLCVLALLLLKKHRTAAFRLSVIAAVLGTASLIASIVFGSVDVTGFLAAAFTVAGAALTERETA